MLQVETPQAALADRLAPPPAALWAAAGFGAAALLTTTALAGGGLGRDGLVQALRVTARLAFAPFWPCYTAGALVVLFGPRFLAVKRRARALGLAFASVMTVHLGLVTALCAIGAPPSEHLFVVFTPGAACVALLATASIPRVGRAIGPGAWWALRNLAMNYVLYDFAIDFTRREPLTSPKGLVEYLPFALLTAAAPALRAAAWLKARRR
jgi:hypothetical protein